MAKKKTSKEIKPNTTVDIVLACVIVVVALGIAYVSFTSAG